MDLLAITSGAVGAINAYVPLQWKASTGSAVGASGKRTPTYAAPVTVPGQVQPLTGKDLKQIEGLNLQGTLQAIYFYGSVDAIVRSANKGGDLVTDGAGNVWLINQVLEHWLDWCRVVATMQLST